MSQRYRSAAFFEDQNKDRTGKKKWEEKCRKKEVEETWGEFDSVLRNAEY
jgi:hypothetical protein